MIDSLKHKCSYATLLKLPSVDETILATDQKAFKTIGKCQFADSRQPKIEFGALFAQSATSKLATNHRCAMTSSSAAV